MIKTEIYQNGFWLMIGLVLGIASTSLFITHKPHEILLKTEVKRDTVVAMRPDLSEDALREKLKSLPHSNIVFKQAKLESGLGRSAVYKRTNNLFGLRKGNKYRTYDHWTECVADYERLVSSKYKGGNYYEFLKRIKYAEDPEYIEKLKRV